jgi:hypothetical protein
MLSAYVIVIGYGAPASTLNSQRSGAGRGPGILRDGGDGGGLGGGGGGGEGGGGGLGGGGAENTHRAAVSKKCCIYARLPPSRGGLPGLAGVSTRPAGYLSGGVPPAVERQLHLLTV